MTVYIPTRGRIGNIEKIVPRWLDQDISVGLVVDPDEMDDHLLLKKDMGWGARVRVIEVPDSIHGIGAIRNFIVRRASDVGLRSIILAEDDAIPNKDSDFHLLLWEARKTDVLGIGAVRPIHDRFTGGAVSRNSGPIMCPGGWGFVLFGLNVENAIAFGNYDETLHTIGDDAEMARQGIVRGIPWRVHCDVKWASLGTRYAPGGINARFRDRDGRTAAERECLAIIHERWPEYTNHPDKRLRMAWQKMLSDFIPDWRTRSALHGGSL